MKITSKKIVGLFFFIAVGTSALFANGTENPLVQPEVTDAELEQFAEAFQGIRVLNQEAQKEMIGIVQKEGMNIQRFNEIQQAAVNPETKLEVEPTEAELKQHKSIMGKIEKTQLSFQDKMEKTITNTGLSTERYQQIATQLQKDPKLQERLRKQFQK